MLGRILALTLCALLFLPAACAQFYVLEGHEIRLDVDEGGNAEVTEKYFMYFQNEQQLFDFKQDTAEIGVNIDGWNAYDSRIYPRIAWELIWRMILRRIIRRFAEKPKSSKN